MKRADIIVNGVYAKASPHYGKSSYGSTNLNATKVTVIDTNTWQDRRSSYSYGRSETTRRVLENGATVEVDKHIVRLAPGEKGFSYYKKGVLCWVEEWHGKYIAVVPLNLLRCTWEEHEQNELDEKLKWERIRRSQKEDSDANKEKFEHMSRLMEKAGLTGIVTGEGYGRYEAPKAVFTYKQFMDLMVKLGEVIVVPSPKEDGK